MTRPRKGDDDKRELMVYVRMTAKEKQKLVSNAAAAGLTPSDFIRTRTIAADPHIKKATPERAAFIRAAAQLGKIGSNLNQIARALNRRSDGDLTDYSPRMVEHGISEADTLLTMLVKLLEKDGH